MQRPNQFIALLKMPVKSLCLPDCIRIKCNKCIQRSSSFEAKIILLYPIQMPLNQLLTINLSLFKSIMDGFNCRLLNPKFLTTKLVGHRLLSHKTSHAQSKRKPYALVKYLRPLRMIHI